MANEIQRAQRLTRVAPLKNVDVLVTSENRIQVEFYIEDLVRKLIPPGDLVANCGGCHGCMGCSM